MRSFQEEKKQRKTFTRWCQFENFWHFLQVFAPPSVIEENECFWVEIFTSSSCILPVILDTPVTHITSRLPCPVFCICIVEVQNANQLSSAIKYRIKIFIIWWYMKPFTLCTYLIPVHLHHPILRSMVGYETFFTLYTYQFIILSSGVWWDMNPFSPSIHTSF